MEPNGFLILAPATGVQPSAAEIAAALEAHGLERWNGNGPPAFAVFHCQGNKGDHFEAGYWAGAGVPVVMLGGGAKLRNRKQIVHRFGAWTVGKDGRATVAELIEALDHIPAAAVMQALQPPAGAIR